MKFTALLREVVTRDIRIIFNADSKGQAKRLAISIASHPDTLRYKEGIVASRLVTVTPVDGSIEQLTPGMVVAIQEGAH